MVHHTKKYGDAFENDFRARLGVMKKIHSRFICIARPLNRFTRVESIQPGFQVLSNGHESIQRTRFNGFKFNRRRPLWQLHPGNDRHEFFRAAQLGRRNTRATMTLLQLFWNAWNCKVDRRLMGDDLCHLFLGQRVALRKSL